MDILKRKRGTPIEWPNGEFNLTQLATNLVPKISRVSLQVHANKAIADGKLKEIRVNKDGKVGRPTRIFSKV